MTFENETEATRPVASAARTHPLRIGAHADRIAREVPEEVAVAIVCNGTSLAVMMATPEALEDFAVGFVLSERIVQDIGEIERLEIIHHAAGIEAQMWIAKERADAMARRRRAMAGPTGCGLCGIESLVEAQRAVPRVCHPMTMRAQEVAQAMAAMAPLQALSERTRGVHAAALWSQHTILALREDVGRHNALDKIVGTRARQGFPAGALLLTSRVSIELVQKAAFANFPILIAISVPTQTAISLADQAGITLVAIARRDSCEVFTHTQRITDTAAGYGAARG